VARPQRCVGRTTDLSMSASHWSTAAWVQAGLEGGGIGHAISLEGFMDDYITHIIRPAGSPLNILTEEDIFPGLVGQSLQCLFAVRFALCTVRCAQFTVRCALCTVRCALCTVRCALCTMSSALCTVQATFSSLQCWRMHEGAGGQGGARSRFEPQLDLELLEL
jgi:hypothetical protein